MENEGDKMQKKHFRILGITIWRIFAYFIIYSFIGFVVETLFGLAKYGVIESRKSFLYGPFCAIYGLGAVVMILLLRYFKKNHLTLFLGGCIVGSVTEYLVSLVGELIFHVKWWDYSQMPFNLNGRICLLYVSFWGVLGLVLMVSINPKIDKLIEFIKEKISIPFLQILVVAVVVIMAFDCMISGIAIKSFRLRTIKENNIEVTNQSYIDSQYDKIYKNEKKAKLINKFFSNETVLRAFPRLTIQNKEGEIILLKDIYPYIKTSLP